MDTPEYEEGKILVVFRPGTLDFKARDIITEVGGIVEHAYTPFEPGHYVVQVPCEYEESLVKRFAMNPHIERVERIVRTR
jgi:hypothetical protein